MCDITVTISVNSMSETISMLLYRALYQRNGDAMLLYFIVIIIEWHVLVHTFTCVCMYVCACLRYNFSPLSLQIIRFKIKWKHMAPHLMVAEHVFTHVRVYVLDQYLYITTQPLCFKAAFNTIVLANGDWHNPVNNWAWSELLSCIPLPLKILRSCPKSKYELQICIFSSFNLSHFAKHHPP